MWLNELWRRWMGQTPWQLRRRRHPSRMHKRLTLEALEERTLLANFVAANTNDLIADINSGNQAGTPTLITLIPSTIYGFGQKDNQTNGGNALPVITGNITIFSTGSGFVDLVRNGTGVYRLFDVASGGTLNLFNLTLDHGLAKGTGTAAEGGAIYSSGTLTLNGVTVKSNTAQGSNTASGNGTSAFGGGLYVAGGSVSLTHSSLSFNNVVGGNGGSGNGGNGENGGSGGSGMGGGMYVTSASGVTLINTTLSNNHAQGGNGGDAGNGGAGGLAGSGAGGGADIAEAGGVTLSNDFVNSNVALGGNSGSSGSAVNPFGGFDGGTGEGGGVVLQASNANLSNDTFSFNAAEGGNGGGGGNGVKGHDRSAGGLGGDGGDGEGGGLVAAVTGSATVSADTFSGNIVFGGLGGDGGNGGNAGHAGAGGTGGSGGFGGGGGLFVEAGGFTLTNDTISNNLVQGSSGGGGGHGGSASLSLFANGGAEGTGGNAGNGGTGAGGGLYVAGGTLSLLNDTVSANSVFGGVGGAGGNAGTEVNGTTIIPNYVDVEADGESGNGGDADGGGVYVQAKNADLNLANTLIAANSIGAGTGGMGPYPAYNGSDGNASGADVSGTVSSSDHDLVGDADGSSGFVGIGDQVGTTANPINPLLGLLNPNGGPTDTIAELPGSPAIGKGDVNALQGLATDQRGAARSVVVNGMETVDIGAYEFGATPPSGTPALSISGSGASSATPGGPITYTFRVTNTSSTAQSNVDVVDQLPANTTLVSWTAAAGWSSSAPPVGSSSGTVSASIASLPANSSGTFTLVVQVAAGTPVGTVIRNTASFGPFADVTNPSANIASITTTILYAPTLQVVDAGGTYNGGPFAATATAVGIDSTTPVAGSFSYAYYAGTSTSGPPLSAVPVNAGTYTVVATFTSSNPDYSNSTAQTTFTIAQATTVLSNLTTQQIIVGTSTTVVSGRLTSNTVIPVGQSISITLNGVTQNATVMTDGRFSVSFATDGLGVGTYPISYSYAGDNNFTAASASGSLTVAYGSQLLFNNSKPVHSGAVLPIKLALTDANGSDISSPNIAVTATSLVDANGNAVPLNAAGNANPNDLFRYDPTLGGYIFNLETTGLTAGTYTLYFTVGNDPTRHSLTFVVD